MWIDMISMMGLKGDTDENL